MRSSTTAAGTWSITSTAVTAATRGARAQANGAGFRSKAILLHDDESYPVRRDAAVTPFLYMQPVVIRYPNVSAVGVSRRRAVVIRDDRGPKVRVRWSADDKKIPGRRYVEYHGAQHEQWILRDRLEAG